MPALHIPAQLPHHSRILPLLSCHTGRRAQETQEQAHIPRLMPKCNGQHFPSKHNWRRVKSSVSFGLSGYVICLGNGSSSKEKPNPVTHIYQQEAVRNQTFTLLWWSLVVMPPPVQRGKNKVPKRRQITPPTATKAPPCMLQLGCQTCTTSCLPTSTLGPQELPVGQLNSFKRKTKE